MWQNAFPGNIVERDEKLEGFYEGKGKSCFYFRIFRFSILDEENVKKSYCEMTRCEMNSKNCKERLISCLARMFDSSPLDLTYIFFVSYESEEKGRLIDQRPRSTWLEFLRCLYSTRIPAFSWILCHTRGLTRGGVSKRSVENKTKSGKNVKKKGKKRRRRKTSHRTVNRWRGVEFIGVYVLRWTKFSPI